MLHWLREKCYWFVNLRCIEEDYQMLQHGYTIELADAYFSGETKELCTSGSTDGNPKYTLIDKEQLELRFAAEWYAMSWTGWKPGDKWIHLWYPQIREHKDSKWKIFKLSMRRRLERCMFLSYFDLNQEKSLIYAQKINKYNPKLIVGYSEALYEFALYLLNNNIAINVPNTISSAGHLPPEWRKTIELAFNTKVWNRYGCSEFGIIAQEDWRDAGQMKVLVQRGISVRNGQNGELLITDCNNKATKFVDYDLGDYGIVKDNVITELRGKLKSDVSYLRIRRN